MSYIKICPNPACRRENDQYAIECANENCRELLGDVPTTPRVAAGSTDDATSCSKATPPPDVTAAAPPSGDSGSTGKADWARDETLGVRRDLLTLQFTRGNRVFNVRGGQILGRHDGSNDQSRVNIPTDAGVDVGYVSRWHCQFHCNGREWTVTPLDPRDFPGNLKKANPTWLGADPLDVGVAYPVRNGDLLTLADVELRIHIAEA